MLKLSCSLPSPRGVLNSAQFCSVHPGCRLPKGPEWLAPVDSRASLLCLPWIPSCLVAVLIWWSGLLNQRMSQSLETMFLSLKMRVDCTASEVDLHWSLFSGLSSPGTVSSCCTASNWGAGLYLCQSEPAALELATRKGSADYFLLPYFDFFLYCLIYFWLILFSYSAYFSGAERLLGADRNQCGNSTSSLKNRYVIVSPLCFSDILF